MVEACMKKLFILAVVILLSGCSTTQSEKRVDEVENRAYKDIYCDREEVVVALISPDVIGARGCGRTRYYSVIHPFN
jgi:uncharacterized lipoprotein YajG